MTDEKFYNEGLEYLLKPQGKIAQIGEEKGTVKPNGISRLRSPNGSNRYLFTINGDIVAALQVKDRTPVGGTSAIAANIYVRPDHRRQGLGTKLLKRATKDFKKIEFSNDLSGSGKLWRAKVESFLLRKIQDQRKEVQSGKWLHKIKGHWTLEDAQPSTRNMDYPVSLLGHPDYKEGQPYHRQRNL